MLAAVAEVVLAASGRVAAGGVGRSGAGMSTFADELVAHVTVSGVQLLRSTTEDELRDRLLELNHAPHAPKEVAQRLRADAGRKAAC